MAWVTNHNHVIPRKSRRNVKQTDNILKAEDIVGHRGDEDIDTLLEFIGENKGAQNKRKKQKKKKEYFDFCSLPLSPAKLARAPGGHQRQPGGPGGSYFQFCTG